MTNNPTIDGVSRAKLEQALKLAAVFDDGSDGADAESAQGVVGILRALLDAPTVERQEPKPAARVCGAGYDEKGSTVWMEIGVEEMPIPRRVELGEKLVFMADTQSTIAQLQARIAELESGRGEQFQSRVQPWMIDCFGPAIAGDREERNHRFLEEALELVQACGASANEAHQLVEYVYGRPVGEPAQEVGGVMVTLAALCLANGLDMHASGETELARIWTKVEQIRAKQAAKPAMSPLPGVYPDRAQPAPFAAQTDLLQRLAYALSQVGKPDHLVDYDAVILAREELNACLDATAAQNWPAK